jgi:hypothetical protein
MSMIQNAYEPMKQNKEECLLHLGEKRKEITKLLVDGRITESQYEILKYLNRTSP